MKKIRLFFFVFVLLSITIAFAQDIRATTDNGQTVMLKKNGTWFFIDRSQPQDASATLHDGRVVTLKKDGTWALTNTTKPVSSIPRPTYTYSAPANVTSGGSGNSSASGKKSSRRSDDDDDEKSYTRVGQQVPSFTFRNLDGSDVNINSLRGRVVLINFWAAWCGPCREEMPRLETEIWQAYKPYYFTMIALGREHTDAEVKEFVRQTGYTFPMAADVGRKIYGLFAGETIPRSYVIGKDGRILYQTAGYGEESFNEMKDVILQALKN